MNDILTWTPAAGVIKTLGKDYLFLVPSENDTYRVVEYQMMIPFQQEEYVNDQIFKTRQHALRFIAQNVGPVIKLNTEVLYAQHPMNPGLNYFKLTTTLKGHKTPNWGPTIEKIAQYLIHIVVKNETTLNAKSSVMMYAHERNVFIQAETYAQAYQRKYQQIQLEKERAKQLNIVQHATQYFRQTFKT